MDLTPKQNTLADEWLTLCSQSYIRYGTKDYDDLVRAMKFSRVSKIVQKVVISTLIDAEACHPSEQSADQV
jgi:hypothetical protein